jgi:hypothetical protein
MKAFHFEPKKFGRNSGFWLLTCDFCANGNKPGSSHKPGIMKSVLNRRILNRRMSNFEVLVPRRTYFCGLLSAAASRQSSQPVQSGAAGGRASL